MAAASAFRARMRVQLQMRLASDGLGPTSSRLTPPRVAVHVADRCWSAAARSLLPGRACNAQWHGAHWPLALRGAEDRSRVALVTSREPPPGASGAHLFPRPGRAVGQVDLSQSRGISRELVVLPFTLPMAGNRRKEANVCVGHCDLNLDSLGGMRCRWREGIGKAPGTACTKDSPGLRPRRRGPPPCRTVLRRAVEAALVVDLLCNNSGHVISSTR